MSRRVKLILGLLGQDMGEIRTLDDISREWARLDKVAELAVDEQDLTAIRTAGEGVMMAEQALRARLEAMGKNA